MSGRRDLGPLDAVANPGAKGFVVRDDLGRELDLFVVRRDGAAYAYVNSCPHIGTPLEIQPDRFLTRDGRLILCSTHGALFEIATGRCIAGPCMGKSLEALELNVIEYRLSVELDRP